jgi:molecular chaperone HtpG
MHYKAEGAIEYTGLLFIPSSKPFDLFNPERKSHLKLYVKRVFITDKVEELLPGWLRFLRGVVDTPDLPLNVSRELLQHNPLLAKIKTGLIKKVLSELKKKSDNPDSKYVEFWENFGPVLKEGLYEARERHDDLLPLCRFRTTHGDGWYSLDDIVARMKPDQEAIYTITGDDLDKLKRSPQLEGFVAKGIEVMLLTDAIDDFWLNAVDDYQGKKFRSVTEAGSDLSKLAGEETPEAQKDKAPEGDLSTLIAGLKLALGDQVQDVRSSNRLTESAVCLVAGEGQMSMHLEKMLRLHGQMTNEQQKVLEINPGHSLIKALAATVAAKGTEAGIEDMAFLLLDQARILEGEMPKDPKAFAKRLGDAMTKGLAS